MSLCFVRPKFVECPTCAAKGGTPALCRECLERREMWYVLDAFRRLPVSIVGRATIENASICPACHGTPNPECEEHGR